MKFYYGQIEFEDGRKFEDFYVNEEDALGYYERAPHFKSKCIRAELFEMIPDENNCRYEKGKCLYEYDVNGKYYFKVG